MANTKIRQEVAEELLRQRIIRGSLLAWCTHSLSGEGQAPAAHHRLIIEYLEKVTAGEIDRLMIFAPPGSAKSTYSSILYPAHFLARHPKAKIIGCAHTADLAERFSGKVRSQLEEHGEMLGFKLREDSRSRERWETTAGGEYRAAGLGAALSGYRADLLMIDDPVKSFEDVQSENSRNKAYDWFVADALTRLRPGGRAVIVMTRWHEDDLAGRLLEHEGDRWTVLTLPAFAESADDPLGRPIGEAIWPEWESAEMLLDKKATMGELRFNGLFQQRPSSEGGTIFRPGAMKVLNTPPDGPATMIRAWDLASSLKGDWTVGAKLARYADGSFCVLDVTRLRGGPDEVEARIVQTAIMDGVECKVSLPRDPGQAGASQVLYLTRKLAGFRVTSSPESGSKEVRAAPLAAQLNAGNVSMVAAPWNDSLRAELAVFPSGKFDDQVDALSRAFAELIVPPRKATVHHLNWTAR